MFAEERPFLLSPPVEPFRYHQYSQRTVHLDGCVEVESATTAHRQSGAAGISRCNGITGRCDCRTRTTVSCSVSTCARRGAVIGSKTKTAVLRSFLRSRASVELDFAI